MVTTTSCYDGTDGYHLCDQTPELMPDVQSCTYRKKGTPIYCQKLLRQFYIADYMTVLML